LVAFAGRGRRCGGTCDARAERNEEESSADHALKLDPAATTVLPLREASAFREVSAG
jgi:hypothetical protein